MPCLQRCCIATYCCRESTGIVNAGLHDRSESFDEETLVTRACNFSAGPAALPEEVLVQAQSELLDWGDTGASVMELSHRGRDFMALAAESEQDLRDRLGLEIDTPTDAARLGD